jgi:hypothetical protein
VSAPTALLLVAAPGRFSNPVVLVDAPQQVLVPHLEVLEGLVGEGRLVEETDVERLDVAVLADGSARLEELGESFLEEGQLFLKVQFGKAEVLVQEHGLHEFDGAHGALFRKVASLMHSRQLI